MSACVYVRLGVCVSARLCVCVSARPGDASAAAFGGTLVGPLSACMSACLSVCTSAGLFIKLPGSSLSLIVTCKDFRKMTDAKDLDHDLVCTSACLHVRTSVRLYVCRSTRGTFQVTPWIGRTSPTGPAHESRTRKNKPGSQ